MALERIPADIRTEGGVARMSDPEMIQEIKRVVTIPVMAKARIGHFVEAQVTPTTRPIACTTSTPRLLFHSTRNLHPQGACLRRDWRQDYRATTQACAVRG